MKALLASLALFSACSARPPTPAALPLSEGAKLSVSATLDAISCSASVSCNMRRTPSAEASALVHVNFVCRGEPDEHVSILRAPLELICDGTKTAVEPLPEPGHLWKREPFSGPLTQLTSYLGADLNPCGKDRCESRFWNLTLELSPEAFASTRCSLTTSMTALMNEKDLTSHPVIDVALDLIRDRRLVCSQHSLDKPGSGVTNRHTEDITPYTQRYAGALR